MINVSAQNGFGGYSTRYFLFSPADLTVLGSCPTLNVNDYDMNDEEELLERIICAMITSFKTELPVSYDMNRLNLILASGKTPKTDLSKFANNGKSA